MKFRMHAVAFAAAALALGHGACAGEAEAKKWIDSEFQPSTLSKEQQTAEMKWFIDAAKKLQAKGVKEISVVSETITTHEYESKTLAKAFEEITGIKVKHDLIQEGDVVEKLQTSMQSGQVDLRRLDQRLRPDRNALPLRQDHEPDRLHGGQGQGVDQPGPRHQGLHRHQLHDRARQEAVPAARPAVRQPVLVPRRPVRAPGPEGQVQGQVRLRPRRAAQLERLRGHRRVLHQRRQDDRRQADLRPHGLRQEGPVARLALHRRVAVDGGHRRHRHPERQAGRRVGHPHLGRRLHAAGRVGLARRRHQLAGRRLCADEVRRLDEEVLAQGSDRHDLRRGRPGARARPDRAADLLVHGLHRRHDQAGAAGRQRRRHAEVAHGAGAERPVLEAGHAERLPGRRLVDLLRRPRRRTRPPRPGSTPSSSPPRRRR